MGKTKSSIEVERRHRACAADYTNPGIGVVVSRYGEKFPHLIGADATLGSQLSGIATLREDYITARAATRYAVRAHRKDAASVTDRSRTLHTSACLGFGATRASKEGDFSDATHAYGIIAAL